MNKHACFRDWHQDERRRDIAGVLLTRRDRLAVRVGRLCGWALLGTAVLEWLTHGVR